MTKIKKYNKLVRDKIPEIIKKKDEIPIAHVANKKEYWQALKRKLKEEVNEFLKSPTREELADILEIIYAICDFKKIDKKELESLRKKKVKQRGGFEKKIILDEVRNESLC
jgi:predicted house-cleaning noncanonical NTP pyrophosphatase (MazG superfamily)